MRQNERDQGTRAGLTTQERDRIKALEREYENYVKPTSLSKRVTPPFGKAYCQIKSELLHITNPAAFAEAA